LRRFPRLDHLDGPPLDEGACEPENVGACQVTGAPLDAVLRQMYRLGLSPEDVGHLERLSDPEVRRRLGTGTQYFPHHHRVNVVAYLQAWAALLEERLAPTAQAAEPILEAAE
jgi:glycine/D-amino acid oxidase-like deaminating enzyme